MWYCSVASPEGVGFLVGQTGVWVLPCPSDLGSDAPLCGVVLPCTHAAYPVALIIYCLNWFWVGLLCMQVSQHPTGSAPCLGGVAPCASTVASVSLYMGQPCVWVPQHFADFTLCLVGATPCMYAELPHYLPTLFGFGRTACGYHNILLSPHFHHLGELHMCLQPNRCCLATLKHNGLFNLHVEELHVCMLECSSVFAASSSRKSGYTLQHPAGQPKNLGRVPDC